MNKNNVFLALIALVIVGGIGVYAWQKGYGNPAGFSVPSSTEQQAQAPAGNVQGRTYEISYTDAGFSPSSLAIKAGDTVDFVNNSSQAFWPASAMHPMHTGYPGSDIKKCGTTEGQSMFDACTSHMQGSSWSFLFTEKGSWNYHDHMNASKYGTIVVE